MLGLAGLTGAPHPPEPGQSPEGLARAERAVMLRRYARARTADLPLFLAAAATTFLIALQFAPPAQVGALFLPALLAEAAERVALRAIARMPERDRARRATLLRVHLIGGGNVAVTAICLLALADISGPDIAPLVAAAALGLSAYSALVHDMLPGLNLIRQGAMLAVFLSPAALTLSAQWPHPTRGALVAMLAAVMLAALLAVIYAHLHRQAARRLRAQREISRARREAERRAQALARVRDEAERAALHDALTGLPNRRFLDRLLDGLADRARGEAFDRRSDARLAVMLVDLDRFKAINDTLGHDAGDHVLRLMADILRDSVREGDFVARIGGDEFVVIAACARPRDAAAAMAARIVERAGRPAPWRGQLCRYGATVGIAFLDPARDSPRRTLADADLALYRAKRLGRGRVEIFGEPLRREADAARLLADDLARGLDAGEFEPWYQPRLSLVDGRVVGVEAVVRWRHPERGVLTPVDFLEAAAESGALTGIDRAMLDRALADRAAFARADRPPPPLNLNAGRGLLAHPDFAGRIRDAALPPGALAFALNDSHRDPRAGGREEGRLDAPDDALRWTADLLSGLGAETELSDFGLGRAGVATLLALRPARLKIHRQVLRPALASPQGREVIRALAAMARALDIAVIAEGVETEAQAALAAALGCGVVQGHSAAAPMPAARLGPWLAAVADRPPLGPFPEPDQQAGPGEAAPPSPRRAPAH
ncbi:MAG: EAL domain-containing protein [Pseudomonadota bacterium]|nr:EAL domain-containing protein [Pseudomonadota bacterium]